MARQRASEDATSTEVEFEVSDRDLFFVRASADVGCTVELERMVHRSDGRLIEYFTVEGAPPDAVLATATEAEEVDDERLVRETDAGGLFEFLVSGPCIGATLADSGAVVRTVRAADGVGRVVADVPPHVEVRTVVETVGDRHDVEAVARRSRSRVAPEFTPEAFRETLVDRLTERQFEIIRTAHANGYFTWPRERSAEECADALGITQPTFAQHLRVGERKLFDALLDDVEPADDPVVVRRPR